MHISNPNSDTRKDEGEKRKFFGKEKEKERKKKKRKKERTKEQKEKIFFYLDKF